MGVEKLLKKLLKRYEAKEIAIVARTKRILEEVKKETDENIKMTLYTSQEGINFGEEAIKLLTMHSIKGLEFKIVILMGLSDKLIPNPMLLAGKRRCRLCRNNGKKITLCRYDKGNREIVYELSWRSFEVYFKYRTKISENEGGSGISLPDRYSLTELYV